MQTLHYGLKPTGFLMLGTSETTGGFTELFNSVDRLHKFYTKKPILNIPDISLDKDSQVGNRPQQYQSRSWSSGTAMAIEPRSKIDLHQYTNDVLLKHYTPVGVVINADLDILQFRGDTSPYLMAAPGKPSVNLLKMVRVNLRVELRAAIQEAKKFDLTITKFELAELVKFEVIPFRFPGLTDCYLLILFEPIAPTPDLKQTEAQSAPASSQRASTSRRVRKTMVEQENLQLRKKLALTQEHLQATLEEQEAIDRDFKAANEEMLSSNEEFQSTNEELETAKEEIQAANEELSTVNEELRHRNLESTIVNNDLLNILSSVQMPILIVDIDLKIGRFTSMAEPIFNLIPADVGRSFTDIRHNLKIPDLERAIAYTIETLTVYQREIQSLSGYWYHLVIRPYTTGDGRVMGVTIVLLDINEVKHRTQEIQSARDYAKAIVETMVEPLIILNSKLQIVTANRAFYQMFEVVPIEVEGQPLHEIGNGQWNIPSLRSQLKEILRHNTPFKNFKVEHIFERIGAKTMLLNALQLFNAGGGQLILLAIVDITEIEQLEVERAQLLLQSQTDRTTAEKANLAKDIFLSILSHELRNPLTAMLGWSRLLLSGKLTAEQSQRGLEVIDRSATNQNQLIADLLDVSSITNGKLRLDIQPIDLIPTITTAIETVAFAAKAKNIQISTHLDPAPYQVLGDSHRLQQVLWNTIGNAIKFTDPGGQIIVSLSMVNVVAPPELAYAQIQVIDNGRGIEPEFLPQIFDRFLQADSSSTRSYNGLGLGLTIVRHLVELHGGRITATSEVGVGSTFTIRLPLVNTAATSPILLLPSNDPPPAAPPNLTGIHALVVDDDDNTRMLIVISLEQYGATVTSFATAAEALQTLQANPNTYHVLLSDIGMPAQDGWMLIRQVRVLSAADGGKIPAAALTAYVSDRDREMALRLGFQAHIAKPIEPYKLAQIVADLARD
jgi:two-component system, chemotaxis family, CheB/CheR fusion protein